MTRSVARLASITMVTGLVCCCQGWRGQTSASVMVGALGVMAPPAHLPPLPLRYRTLIEKTRTGQSFWCGGHMEGFFELSLAGLVVVIGLYSDSGAFGQQTKACKPPSAAGATWGQFVAPCPATARVRTGCHHGQQNPTQTNGSTHLSPLTTHNPSSLAGIESQLLFSFAYVLYIM